MCILVHACHRNDRSLPRIFRRISDLIFFARGIIVLICLAREMFLNLYFRINRHQVHLLDFPQISPLIKNKIRY